MFNNIRSSRYFTIIKKNRWILTSVLCLSIIAGCKRYDSNEVNKQLLQGKWLLMELSLEQGDSIYVEKLSETTQLTIWGDSCVEEMKDIGSERRFSFYIDNYVFHLKEENEYNSLLDITKLTTDTLIVEVSYREIIADSLESQVIFRKMKYRKLH